MRNLQRKQLNCLEMSSLQRNLTLYAGTRRKYPEGGQGLPHRRFLPVKMKICLNGEELYRDSSEGGPHSQNKCLGKLFSPIKLPRHTEATLAVV